MTQTGDTSPASQMTTTALAAALEDLHARIATVVAGMDAPDFNRRFAPGIGSVWELVTEVAAEEYHWIGEIVAGLPAAEASTASVSSAETGDRQTVGTGPHPLFKLGSSGQFSQAILANLSPAAWETPHMAGDRQLTTVECVLHVIGELGRTLGKIEMMAELARR
jgi:hypothetical protein